MGTDLSAETSVEAELLGLRGKAAIVTGGGGGIGAATVELFTKLGVNLVAVDQRFKDELVGESRGRVVRFQADVSNFEKAEEAVRVALKEFGKLDILVNNAAVNIGGSIQNLKQEEWNRVIEVNLGGYMNYARAASKSMIERGVAGRIVNISSVDGIMAEPGILAYSATKGGIIILTKCLAIELAPYRIRVNSVAPGWTETPGGTGMLDLASRRLVNERIPMRYIASPEEIARTIVFLASDLSKYMTGTIMLADGGLTSDISIPGLKY